MKKFEPEVFATLVDYVISLLIIYKLDFYKYLYTSIYRNIFIPPLKLVCTWMLMLILMFYWQWWWNTIYRFTIDTANTIFFSWENVLKTDEVIPIVGVLSEQSASAPRRGYTAPINLRGRGAERCMECRDNQEKCDSIYFYISHDINTISSWLVLFPIFYFLPFRA